MMMAKTISKVIVYYEDGTYEEVKTGANDSSNKQNPSDVKRSPITPDLRPDYTQIRDWPLNPPQVQPNQPTWTPQYTRETWPQPMVVTCGDTSSTYKFTSTGNFAPDNKYSITSTGNGNVDLSK